tara:strand:- start:2156 stop:2416 length:261 start_codon:yes stop_codon:yes gene_type:complete
MSQQLISTGGSPNDGTGDALRVAFTKSNNNFTELYSRIRNTVPVTNIGSVGDVAGSIAYDSVYVYVCFADYDGSSVIWGRVSTTWA